MLNMYQLWLDDLYPRAKFADGLAIIEKLGHTKRIQFMRKQWIHEGKPRPTAEEDEGDVEPIELDQTRQADTGQMKVVEMWSAQRGEGEQGASPQMIATTAGTSIEDGPDEDELDALLAESAAPALSTMPTILPSRAIAEVDDPFADEIEAMADMEW
jgi:replication fork protection complex subunit Csm3/Swi3